MNQILRQKLLLLLVITITCGNFISCRKACFYKSLGTLGCNPGYIPVNDVIYKNQNYGSWSHPIEQLVVINDLDSYKNACPNYNDSMPFGYIDFSVKTMIGINISLNMNGGYDQQGCFCYNPDSEKWLFKIEYTLKNQCKGSGISRSELLCVLICPKLPSDAVVVHDIKDINPF